MPTLAKPVSFDPYRRRRSGWRLPRWLVLLLLGMAAGAAGVLYAQQRYLPPRLSADESERLLAQAMRAEAEQQRLQRELAALAQKFDAASQRAQRSDAEATAGRSALEKARADLATLVTALPPDPRGGEVEVRAARFSATAGQLAYELVLTRRQAARPMDGLLKLVVAGAANGRETTVALQPVAVSVGAHEVVQGSARLPDDFTPKQTTVQVLARADGRSLGMRVLRVD